MVVRSGILTSTPRVAGITLSKERFGGESGVIFAQDGMSF